MLRGELPGSDERFENAYYELSSQEWIDYQPDPSLNTTFLEVERNLRPRLRSYYRNDPDRYLVLSEARDRLGPALARLVQDRPLNEIGVDLIDAAMRLLPPTDAARLWDKVAGQIRAQGDWAWADQRTSRLLGADGAVADPGHPARAAVLASRISALIHTRSEYTRHRTGARSPGVPPRARTRPSGSAAVPRDRRPGRRLPASRRRAVRR